MGIPTFRFVDRHHEQFVCSICLDVAADPVATNNCGHIYCESCLSVCEQHFRPMAQCPSCQQTLQQPKFKPIEGPIKRVYLDLRMKCLNNSCHESLDISSYLHHDNNCLMPSAPFEMEPEFHSMTPYDQIGVSLINPMAPVMDSGGIHPFRRYNWRGWGVVRDTDYVFIRSNRIVLKLYIRKNGYSLILINNIVTINGPDGSTKTGSSEVLCRYLEKLIETVRPGVSSQEILPTVGRDKLTIHDWTFSCHEAGILTIQNSANPVTTIQLTEYLHRLVYVCGGTKRSFEAKTFLGPEFNQLLY